MTDKIRAYIEHAFERIPQTQNVQELKEELIANLQDKYNEQLSQGKSPEAAYYFVINSIGDLNELVDSVRPQQPALPMETRGERTRRALFISIAVGLYIISPFPLILLEGRIDENVGITIMFLCVAIATGLLIFNYMTRPIYTKTEDTVVEDFKKYRFETRGRRKAFKSFLAAYWIIVVGIYLLISFVFHIWAFSWILFIIAEAIEQIIRGMLSLKGGER